MKKWTRHAFVVLAAFVFVLSLAGRAHAVTVAPNPFSCTVLDVGWDGRVFVDCANVSTRFFTYSSITCPGGTIARSVDDMKMYQSFAVSALLSGKPLSITFDNNCETAAGTNVGVITSVKLTK